MLPATTAESGRLRSTTDANGTGSRRVSVTFPVTVMFWAAAGIAIRSIMRAMDVMNVFMAFCFSSGAKVATAGGAGKTQKCLCVECK